MNSGKPIPPEEELELYRRCHEEGQQDYARKALGVVAAVPGMAMPPWLAEIVLKAIRTSARGKPDDLLGFGNAKALTRWRKRFIEGRDLAIRQGVAYAIDWHRARETGVTKKQLIANRARVHSISDKAIEKILYPGKAASLQGKKKGAKKKLPTLKAKK